MALPKVCGIETEYGIVVRGAENNPVSASSLLINAYVAATTSRQRGRVGWDFDDEQPANDARGFSLDDVDGAGDRDDARQRRADQRRPLLRRPRPPRDLHARRSPRRWRPCAGTAPPRRSSAAAWSTPTPSCALTSSGPAEVIVHKNNSDGKGNSYGCHENYLLARETPFGRIVAQVTPHFVTRQIFTGAGKVGCELPGVPFDHVPYQLSQRADFFEEEVGLETTLKRPIVNTRDEPHCDAQKYRRLHVIVGDANMSEVATYLKVGTTAIVLAMIEDDALGEDWLLGNPVSAIRQISHDPTMTRTIMLRDGRRATALEIQWGLLERARKYEQLHGLACVDEAVGRDVLAAGSSVLDRARARPRRRSPTGSTGSPSSGSSTATPSATASRPGSPRLKAIDLQYHDLRPDRGLAARAGLETLVDPADVETAITEPPTSTRAYFRGRCLAKYPDEIVAANWDSIVFDVGREPLRRVPMMEPLRGTADHVARLIDESDSAVELLERLGS